MVSTTSFAATASLVGDPARANMLSALMDGRALTATELARIAGVTPQTASGHLARLMEGQLLAVLQQGRHRYYRLATASVAHMLESIMSVAVGSSTDTPGSASRVYVPGPRDAALRRARTCYDHLAGRLAVAIADRMEAQGHIEFGPDGGMLTDCGATFLCALGVDFHTTKARIGRSFCRACLDWSERRPHIAGAVGAALCRCCFDRGWLRKMEDTRAVQITPAGRLELVKYFDITAEFYDR